MGKGAAAVAQWMSNPNRFADFYNGNVFHGANVVRPEELEPAKGDSHILIEDKEQKKKEIYRQRDVTKRWKPKGEDINLVILACENQKNIHYGMPVRNMLYDSLAYQEQMNQRWNRLSKEEKKKCTPEEFLSRYRLQDKLAPVITLVLYYGEERWDANKELYEMLDMENLNMFHTDLQQVFGMLKYKRDKEGLDEYIKQNPEYFENVDKETSFVIAELLNSESILKNAEKLRKGEKMSMCKALEDLYNDGKIEGEERGVERFAKLNKLLLDENRIDDLKHASEDAEYRKRLFEEFGI